LNSLRKHIVFRMMWGLLALHFLNVSVDTMDMYADYIPEDIHYNDQESIAEIVVEQFLGYEDAFAEYDDVDHENHTGKKRGLSIKIYFQSAENKSDIETQINALKHFSISENYLSIFCLSLDSPPPQV